MQRGDAEPVGLVVADLGPDQRVELHARAFGERLELVAEGELARRRHPVEQRDIAGRRRQRLQQRTQRCDADAAGDERDPPSGPPVGGEGAVRAFREHSRPPPYVLQLVGVVAQVLHGDAQVPAVRGAADSEKGWAFAQPCLVRNRHRKNCPG